MVTCKHCLLDKTINPNDSTNILETTILSHTQQIKKIKKKDLFHFINQKLQINQKTQQRRLKEMMYYYPLILEYNTVIYDENNKWICFDCQKNIRPAQKIIRTMEDKVGIKGHKKFIFIGDKFKEFNEQCFMCGSKEKLALDHFYPYKSFKIKLVDNNCIVLCTSCNSKKNLAIPQNFFSKEQLEILYTKYKLKRLEELF